MSRTAGGPRGIAVKLQLEQPDGSGSGTPDDKEEA